MRSSEKCCLFTEATVFVFRQNRSLPFLSVSPLSLFPCPPITLSVSLLFTCFSQHPSLHLYISLSLPLTLPYISLSLSLSALSVSVTHTHTHTNVARLNKRSKTKDTYSRLGQGWHRNEIPAPWTEVILFPTIYFLGLPTIFYTRVGGQNG